MSPRVLGNRYALEAQIARGGMGAIWLGRDIQLERRVAVKLMLGGKVRSRRARVQFESEALAIARFHHPNVVRIYDYGIDDGEPFIVMELLQGEDLKTRFDRSSRIPLGSIAGIVMQAARALGVAHQAGVVHRDLKPGNIFLEKLAGREVVKILDFGLVEAARAEPTEDSSRLLGTPGYMSPEQAASEPCDHRSDLWSLAMVAYVMLCGRLPFEGGSVPLMLYKICMEDVPPITSLAPDLPSELNAFFAKALSRDPAGRFGSAPEMASALMGIAEAASTRTAKILFVDDEPDMVELVKQRFRRQRRSGKFELLFAGDGVEAVDVLRENPDVDVVVTDINMPRMDGLTFLSKVGDVNPVVRVIIASAYGDMANLRTAMNRGAFDFVTKPVDFKDLETTIMKTLQTVRVLRRTLVSEQEASILRLFVGGGMADRLVALAGDDGQLAAQDLGDATVVEVLVDGFNEYLERHSVAKALLFLNEFYERILPEFTSRQGALGSLRPGGFRAVFHGVEHGEAAVASCLAARSRLAEPMSGGAATFSMRAGIAEGEVAWGTVGGRDVGRVDYAAFGDGVERALALVGQAGRGRLVATASLAAALSDRFVTKPVGAVLLPGDAAETDFCEVLASSHAPPTEDTILPDDLDSYAATGQDTIATVAEFTVPPDSVGAQLDSSSEVSVPKKAATEG